MKLRRWLILLLGVILAGPALAQDDWPKRSIRLVVPYPPGGPADVMGRLVAATLQQALAVTVVVDNRAGGSGTIGAEVVRQPPADGYTLLAAPSVFVLGPNVLCAVPYDPIRDFTPVTRYGEGPLLVLVNPTAVSGNTIADALREIRVKPQSFSIGLSAFGAANHLAVLEFQRLDQLNLLIVPYRGSAPALSDLVGGQVQLMIDPVATALPLVRSGKLKALAITSHQRSKVAPDIPTSGESGMAGLEISSWYGVWGPKDLPPSIRARVADAISGMARDRAIAARVAAMGFNLVVGQPADFARYIEADLVRSVALLKAAGYQPE